MNECWFRRGLLRHTGFMDARHGGGRHRHRGDSCRTTHQYEVMSVIPTAPIGDVPTTFEEWATTMMEDNLDA